MEMYIAYLLTPRTENFAVKYNTLNTLFRIVKMLKTFKNI